MSCREKYTGSLVRSKAGRKGRFSCVAEDTISITWQDGVKSIEESVVGTDLEAVNQLEYLNTKGNWRPVSVLFRGTPAASLRESAQDAVQFLEDTLRELGMIPVAEAKKDAVDTKKAAKTRVKKKKAALKKKLAAAKDKLAVKKVSAKGAMKSAKGKGKTKSSPEDMDKLMSVLTKKPGGGVGAKKTAKKEAPPEKPHKRPKAKTPIKGGTDKDHHPFKREKNLGPGPRSATLDQVDCWDCEEVSPYKQHCVYKSTCPETHEYEHGQVKIIRIKKDYKKKYNKDYRDWVAKGDRG